jgi:hypothetical protein
MHPVIYGDAPEIVGDAPQWLSFDEYLTTFAYICVLRMRLTPLLSLFVMFSAEGQFP